MSRETLKNFLNLKGHGDQNKISFTFDQEPADRGTGTDIDKDAQSGEKLLDLDDETVGLLGDYLSYIIENEKNVFGIAPGNERAASSNRGDSLVLAEEQGANDVFIKQGTTLANELNKNSNSRYFDAAGVPVSDFIDKTGKDSDSHLLLSEIEGTGLSSQGNTTPYQAGDESSQPIQAVNSVLLQNNRFSNVPGAGAFAQRGSSPAEIDENSLLSNNQYGIHSREEYLQTISNLKQIGSSLLLKSTGYDGSDTPGQSNDIFEAGSALQSDDISSNRIGPNSYEKIDVTKLRSKNAKGFPETESGDSTRTSRGEYIGNDPEAKNSKSFGSTYNSFMTFSSNNRRLHKIQAAVACLALKKVTTDFMSQITEFIRFNDLQSADESTEEFVSKDKTYMGPGPYTFGENNQLNLFELDLLKKLVLVRTDYPYAECFTKGIEVFFGNDDDVDKVKNYENINQAPGYWLSVATSILKSFDDINSNFTDQSTSSGVNEKLHLLLEIVKSNKLIQFANVAATVGDIFFKTTGGLKNSNDLGSIIRPFDVDALPSTPGTRVSKSRDTKGDNPLNLAWRQDSVPSMYLLPKNLIKATLDMNTVISGPSAARGMLASSLIRNTFVDYKLGGSFNRIPNHVVKKLEDRLEAEYVPFYFRDMRTNEIISFHAFLTALSDNITSNFNAVDGYGRMDPVQIYKNTTRSLTVGFSVYATSKEDFNTMWYKINKFVTLLYPQWTQGTKLTTTGNDKFVQPFSQVLGASPIVRLRIGDVIKTNYSRFNLARTFGIGDEDIVAVPGDTSTFFSKLIKDVKANATGLTNFLSNVLLALFYITVQSPTGLVPEPTGDSRLANLGLKILSNVASLISVNGFANPLGVGLVAQRLIDPNSQINAADARVRSFSSIGLIESFASNLRGNSTGHLAQASRVILKSNTVKGYKIVGAGNLSGRTGGVAYTSRPVKCFVLESGLPVDEVDSSTNATVTNNLFKKSQTSDASSSRTRYKLLVIDPASDLFGAKIEADHAHVLPDPADLFMTTVGAPLAIAQPRTLVEFFTNIVREAGVAAGVGSELGDLVAELYATDSQKFMQPENNPFTRALEATQGRGLAGVIKGITFNWLSDYPWETDYNSRAPIGVDIQFNFDVIHDLPPGLDHSGYNKAPLYNVGDILKEIQGDAYGDDLAAQFEYTRNGVSMKTGDK